MSKATQPVPNVESTTTPHEDAIDDQKRGASELSRADFAELRRLLEARRDSILADFDEKRGQDRGASHDVGDEMDEANVEGATSMASKLLERDVRLLGEIERALGKMREGAYGVCEGTEEPIGFARLRLQPWARFSVQYQEELEREARSRGR